MKTPLALTLLATVLGVAALNPSQAGAGTNGVRWTETPTITINTFPAGMHEGGTYTIPVGDGVTLADHRTDNMAWIESDGSDVQPLGYAFNQVNGTITFTIAEHVDCSNHQLDLIVGEPLAQVDRGSRNRYNRTPYGGSNRLIAATYVAAANDCGTPEPTTTTEVVLPPATVPSTPVEVFRSDPTPPTSTTTAVVVVDDPLTSTTDTPTTLYTAPVPTLPVTGGSTAKLLWLAGVNLAGGALLIGGTKIRRRNNNAN